jgi:anthranilate/para-aminobenzoate synthase component II
MLSGGRVEPMGFYLCTLLPIQYDKTHPLFQNMTRRKQRFCFSEKINIKDTLLRPIAWMSDGSVCAFEHPNLPWIGCLFHPEVTPEIIHNFIELCYSGKLFF